MGSRGANPNIGNDRIHERCRLESTGAGSGSWTWDGIGGALDDGTWVLELPAVAPAPTEEGAAGLGSLARLWESQRFMTLNDNGNNDDNAQMGNGCKFGNGYKFGNGGPPSTLTGVFGCY